MAGMAALETRLEREPLIARGQTSDVFSWGEACVLKLYFPSFPATVTQREFAITRAIHAAGLPVPAVVETIEIAGRHGIIFERIRGHSLLRAVERKPWMLFAAARQLAELHARLHATTAPAGLPSQREQIAQWLERADVPDADKAPARQHLAQLPDGDSLCHGDFHPANILLTARGPVIIDWSTGTRGHALADVARTSVLFERANLPPDSALHVRMMMKFARRRLHATYLKRYLQWRPGTLEQIEFWRVPQRMALVV
jgi:uncharacterized protein (TIGR02172 family)